MWELQISRAIAMASTAVAVIVIGAAVLGYAAWSILLRWWDRTLRFLRLRRKAQAAKAPTRRWLKPRIIGVRRTV